MLYQKKYPITGSQSDFLLLEWEKGYRNLNIYFKDRLVNTVKSPAVLKKGFTFYDEELKKIQLIFSEKPLTINVIVDGYHSPVNLSHPKNEFKKVSGVFWAIVNINLFIILVSAFALSENFIQALPTLIISFLLNGIYIVAAIFSKKNKVWAFGLGSIYFALSALLSLFAALISFNFFTIFSLTYYGIILSFLIKYTKTANSFIKHEKLTPAVSLDLLDN